MKLTAHLYLVLKLTMAGAKPVLPHMPLWHVQWQLFLWCLGRRDPAYASKVWVVLVPVYQTAQQHIPEESNLKKGWTYQFYGNPLAAALTQCSLLVILYRMTWASDVYNLSNRFCIVTDKFAHIRKNCLNSGVCACVHVCGSVTGNSSSLKQWHDLLKVCLQLNLQAHYCIWQLVFATSCS
jgi:hypothetical protein